jgi:hypothetical protein
MEAVRLLRPNWLSRIAGAYVDGRELTDDELEAEPIQGIVEIRFLTGSEATAQLGAVNRSSSAGYLHIIRRGY